MYHTLKPLSSPKNRIIIVHYNIPNILDKHDNIVYNVNTDTDGVAEKNRERRDTEMTITEEQKIIIKFCAHCKYYWATTGCEHGKHPTHKPHSECPDYERIQALNPES